MAMFLKLLRRKHPGCRPAALGVLAFLPLFPLQAQAPRPLLYGRFVSHAILQDERPAIQTPSASFPLNRSVGDGMIAAELRVSAPEPPPAILPVTGASGGTAYVPQGPLELTFVISGKFTMGAFGPGVLSIGLRLPGCAAVNETRRGIAAGASITLDVRATCNVTSLSFLRSPLLGATTSVSIGVSDRNNLNGNWEAQFLTTYDYRQPSVRLVDVANVDVLRFISFQDATPRQARLLNTGLNTVNWSATGQSQGNWLSITPATGSLAPGASTPVTINVDPNLLPGRNTYRGQIVVTVPGGSPTTLEVDATITESLSLSDASPPPARPVLPGPELTFRAKLSWRTSAKPRYEFLLRLTDPAGAVLAESARHAVPSGTAEVTLGTQPVRVPAGLARVSLQAFGFEPGGTAPILQSSPILYTVQNDPDRVSVNSISPRPQDGIRWETFYRFTASADYTLATRPVADLAFRITSTAGVLLASSDFQRVSRGSGSARFSIIDFRVLAGLTSAVRAQVVLIDPLAGAVIGESEIFRFEVLPGGQPTDLGISRVRAIQSNQDAAGSVPLAIGKQTVVRALVRVAGTAVSDFTGRLSATRAGVPLPGSPLVDVMPGKHVRFSDSSREFDLLGRSLNFTLPAGWTSEGEIDIEVEVEPPSGTIEENAGDNRSTLKLKFEKPPKWPEIFAIGYIPFTVENPAGPNAPFAPDASQYAIASTLLEKILPLPSRAISYFPLAFPETPLKGVADTDQWRSHFMRRLERIFNWVNAASPGLVHQLMAWLPREATSRVAGTSNGAWVKGQGRVTVGYTGFPNPETTMAHELGHNLGLRHTAAGIGCDGSVDSATWWPHGGSYTIQQTAWDHGAFRPIPSRTPEFMSYCPGELWISPFHAEFLFRTNALRPFLNIYPPNGMKIEARTAAAHSVLATNLMLISGSLRRDGTTGSLEPAYQVTSPGLDVEFEDSGDICLRIEEDRGPSNYCFPVSFQDAETLKDLEEGGFSMLIPSTSPPRRIALLFKGLEIASLSAGQSPPRVSFLQPLPESQWNAGIQAITWNGSDPDGDPLTYSLHYSPDNRATWLPLELDLSESNFRLDSTKLRGQNDVFLRVVATDGLHSTNAETGPIRIAQQPRIEALSNAVTLGVAALGGFIEKPVVVRNSGGGAAAIASVVSTDPQFQAVSDLPLNLWPAAPHPLRIRYTPVSTGSHSSILTLTGLTLTGAGSGAGSPVTIRVSARAVNAGSPALEISAASLDFGELTPGQSLERNLQVRNAGFDVLNLQSIRAAGPGFSTSATAIALEPDASAVIPIRFVAAAAGLSRGTLSLSSNDPDSPERSVPLSGSGLGAAIPPPGPSSIFLSDSFSRSATDPCALGAADQARGGSGLVYYLPVFGGAPPAGAALDGATLNHRGLDYGGVQFHQSSTPCSASADRVFGLGENLYIRLDLLVPRSGNNVTQAGPFLRARAASRGDGILGGANTGYWVQLHSTGEVKIKSLASAAIVAFSAAIGGFDAARFHTLDVSANGTRLKVWLDGTVLLFDKGSDTVSMDPAVNSAGGIAFGAETNRGVLGGQKAGNLIVGRP